MMTCPNQAQNRQSSLLDTVEIQLQHSHAVIKNADTPHQDMPNAAEKKCMMQPRITPADGVAQSCVMPSPYCPVAMAYVPFQAFEELFEESKTFINWHRLSFAFQPVLS